MTTPQRSSPASGSRGLWALHVEVNPSMTDLSAIGAH